MSRPKNGEFVTVKLHLTDKRNGFYWYQDRRIIGMSLYREGWYIIFMQYCGAYWEMINFMKCPEELIGQISE